MAKKKTIHYNDPGDENDPNNGTVNYLCERVTTLEKNVNELHRGYKSLKKDIEMLAKDHIKMIKVLDILQQQDINLKYLIDNVFNNT